MSNSEFDLFYRVKRDEYVPLIGHVTMIRSPKNAQKEEVQLFPVFCYDKLDLFDVPFLTIPDTPDSSDFRINLPFRVGVEDPGIDCFIALFMLKGMVIEVANLYLPQDSSRVEYFTGEKWFEWGNPRPEGFPPPPFGWAATQIEAIKDFSVQIYA